LDEISLNASKWKNICGSPKKNIEPLLKHPGRYFEVDLAGTLTFFNESLCEIYGYPKEELMGMNNRQYADKENAKKSV